MTATVLAGWLGVIEQAASRYKLDFAGLLQRSGIDPELLQQGTARVPQRKISDLMQLAMLMSNDRGFALTVARQVRPPSWYSLGYAIWASDTLLQGCQRLQHCAALFADAFHVQLIEHDRELQVVLRQAPLLRDPLLMLDWEVFAATIVLTIRHLHPAKPQPLRVVLPGPEPEMTVPFKRLFGEALAWQGEEVVLTFSASLMKEWLPGRNPELARQHDELSQRYLQAMNHRSFSRQVYEQLLSRDSLREVEAAQVAEALHMNLRTFQRRLQDEECCFRELLDQARHALCCRYLNNEQLSMGEISYLLGFANVSNLYRAFRRWRQEAPGEYRQRRRHDSLACLQTGGRSAQALIPVTFQ